MVTDAYFSPETPPLLSETGVCGKSFAVPTASPRLIEKSSLAPIVTTVLSGTLEKNANVEATMTTAMTIAMKTVVNAKPFLISQFSLIRLINAQCSMHNAQCALVIYNII